MYEKIIPDESFLNYAFRSSERQHITNLVDRANKIIDMVQLDVASPLDKQEYYSIKWVLKTFGIIDKDNLKKA